MTNPICVRVPRPRLQGFQRSCFVVMSRLHWFRRQAQLVRLCSGRGMTFRFCSRRPVRTYRPSLNSGINAALCIAKRLQYYAFRVSLVPSPWPLRSLRLKINRWKVRDGEDTIAGTRDACAPRNLRTATATGECLDTARSLLPHHGGQTEQADWRLQDSHERMMLSGL